MSTLRQTTAYALISTRVQARPVEVVLDEIAVEFGGSDLLKPDPRARLGDAKQKLLDLHDDLLLLNMEVVLREPLYPSRGFGGNLLCSEQWPEQSLRQPRLRDDH